MDEDEELLQDFIIEAGEILDQLGEQLVELENRPKDMDLLNAVFRGFHTIKGGGSFLALHPLVELCHRAEDVFNVLRNGERDVDEAVIDVILPVLDILNEQFDAIRNSTDLPSAGDALLQRLDGLLTNDTAASVEEKSNPQVPHSNSGDSIKSTPASGDITDDEFDKLLDTLDDANCKTDAKNNAKPTTPPKSNVSENFKNSTEEITDEEFEKLLDSMPDTRSGDDSNSDVSASSPVDKVESSVSEATGAVIFDEFLDVSSGGGTANSADDGSSQDGDITEDEFEKLLDSLPEAKVDNSKSNENQKSGQPQSSSTKSGDDITDDEFEGLLDTIQASRQGQSVSKSPIDPIKSSVPEQTKAAPKKDQPVKKVSPSKSVSKPAASAPKRDTASQADSTVRVDTKRLDDIMNMVGELVLVRNRMATLGLANTDEELAKVVANLDVVTSDLQTAVMKTRMQPIKKVFGRFPRVVRDLARSLKKEVQLEMQGEETDLDKNLVEALADPLIHLVRNAVDHGIESPEDREKNSKPRMGTITLTAEQEGDHILLTIEDDGKGMDANVLRKAAVTKGMMDENSASRLDDKECYNLIFHPGFSTKTEISDVSGRGVGMDVVKTSITQLNGSVEIDSEIGRGSVIIIKVPLTLAIMPTLMIVLENQIFALPLANVNEIFDLDANKTNTVDGQLVIMVREKALPLFYLRNWLVNNCASESLPSVGHVVVVTMGARKIGFVVDSLIGQEEVVIKPLGALLHGMKGLAGATITGDGRISLILDIPGLMQKYAR